MCQLLRDAEVLRIVTTGRMGGDEDEGTQDTPAGDERQCHERAGCEFAERLEVLRAFNERREIVRSHAAQHEGLSTFEN